LASGANALAPPTPQPGGNDRFHPERGNGDTRTATQVDRDRLLYATALSRLAEVTQVVSADQGHVFHNRLTHSLKVAQLARRIAEALRQRQPKEADQFRLDPDAAEAAGLAHDLGHPPFGHIAEEHLHELAQEAHLADGFEGNAQSFRIVTKLATSDAHAKPNQPPIPGLNLTRATLNGILKYPWVQGTNDKKPRKWGAYKTEQKEFAWARAAYSGKTQPVLLEKSAEAEIMDWADDITYAVHDLVDFYSAGKIPLDRLAAKEDDERGRFFDEVFTRNEGLAPNRKLLEDVFKDLMGLLPLDRRYEGTDEQRRNLWGLVTVLITRFVKAMSLDARPDAKKLVAIDSNNENEIAMLKQLTWHYVILRDDLASEQHGQRRMIGEVFRVLMKQLDAKGEPTLFPMWLRAQIHAAGSDTLEKKRLVVDYVSGMTERELMRSHRVLTGSTLSFGPHR
jgi:dGTPase